MTPLHDYVFVRLAETEGQTPGGIFLPDSTKEKIRFGRVLAVGPGKLEDGKVVPMSVQAGDHVLCHPHGGSIVDVEGEELLVIHDTDLMGVHRTTTGEADFNKLDPEKAEKAETKPKKKNYRVEVG